MNRRRNRKKLKDVVHFYKVSGAGNDFVLIDAGESRLQMPKSRLVKALCARGHSIGADGVLFIEKSLKADFRLLYYNADGGAASMCGNGARCAAVFASRKGIAKARMTMETSDGIVEAKVSQRGAELKLGAPRCFREKMSLRTSTGTVEGCSVNTGVPHFVIVVKDVEAVPVESLGRALRFHRAFTPEGTNVNFVSINSSGEIAVRTYERGVEGETLACGTGVVATAICLAVKKLAESPVRIRTAGGDSLFVRFSERGNPLSAPILRGPASVVYEGFIPVSVLRKMRIRPQSGE